MLPVLLSMRQSTSSCFSDEMLNVSPVDTALMLTASPTYVFRRAVQLIASAKSHDDVYTGLARLQLLLNVHWRSHLPPHPSGDAVKCDPGASWWHLAGLQRFMRVLPACTADYGLLVQCLDAIRRIDLTPPHLPLGKGCPGGGQLGQSLEVRQLCFRFLC